MLSKNALPAAPKLGELQVGSIRRGRMTALKYYVTNQLSNRARPDERNARSSGLGRALSKPLNES
jgi:hypothetical protein